MSFWEMYERVDKMLTPIEGPETPASLAFRVCPGCGELFYSAGPGCAKCVSRYTIERPTCVLLYCIDCGWTVRQRNQYSKRCPKCADLYNFNTNYAPSIARFVEAVESGKRSLRVVDEVRADREILERLDRSVWKRTPAPLQSHERCRVPTCEKRRIYASHFCTNHDQDLNGPLTVAIPGFNVITSLMPVGRCMFCRIWVASRSPLPVCFFHDATAVRRWPILWNERIEQWTTRCPVCFRRFDDPYIKIAWAKYAEHHLLRHKEVALLAT